MLNSAKIITALQRKCAISEKNKVGARAPRPLPWIRHWKGGGSEGAKRCEGCGQDVTWLIVETFTFGGRASLPLPVVFSERNTCHLSVLLPVQVL